MLDYIFSNNSEWSWFTFFLYYIISVIVVKLCKTGIDYDTACQRYNNGHRKWSKSGNVCYFFAFLLLTLLATIRSDQVGSDTWKYVEDFNAINLSNNEYDFDIVKILGFHQREPGYIFFVSFIRSISSNYHFLFFSLYSLLSVSYLIFIRYFLRKGMNVAFLKLFIIFYVANMSGMRSALATVPLLISFVYLDKRKYLQSSILTLIAVSCHYTMLFNFAIILGFFFFSKYPRLYNSTMLLCAGIFSVIFSVIGSKFLLGLFSETKYSFYTENLADLTITGSLIYVIFALLLVCNLKYIKIVPYSEALYKITGLFILSYPLLFITGAYRIPNYYALPRLIMWCLFMSILCKRDPKNNFLYKIVCEMVVFIYILYRFYVSSLDGYFVYQI